MKRLHQRAGLGIALVAIAALIAAACSQLGPNQPGAKPAGPVAPITVPQAAAPALAAVPQPGGPVNGFAAPAPGPNLLAKSWPERLGVTVSDLKAPTGPAVLNPKPGDLWFFSNSSTTWGATNTKNGVWVVDARTKKTIANVAPFDGEGNSSHGIAVSADGKYVYLPMLGKNNHVDVLDGRTLEVVQTITTLGRAHHWKLWHDPNTNKDLILGEDFNWGFAGSGVYAFDPSQDNAVVGGMSLGDFAGNPYVTTPSPDGSFIVVTVPAPTAAMRDKMDGYLAKVDPKTWKVVGMTPMIDPLWAEVTLDGKFAYVTSGAEARLYKVNLETMKIDGEVQTGPGPWGARLSYDQSKIYTADKGEGPGYNQQGRTSTIIDLQTLGVSNVVPIGMTTDHAILSPDGKEVWFTSNAEHGIYVLDTTTNQMTIVKDPTDGDTHGGVFVQYSDDGKGGVIGEVVADYSGLHGSALAAQHEYVHEPALTIALGANGFIQKSLSLTTGQATRLTIKNTAGPNAGRITFESKDLGISQITLGPGESKEVRWTAPAQPAELQAKTSKTPNDTLTLSIKAPQPKPVPAAAPADAVHTVSIHTHMMTFDVTNVTVKAGETVRFVLANGDDEKHNLVGLGEGLNLLSPDVAAGTTATYEWTAPSTPGTYKVLCAYHPQMIFDLVIQ